MELSTLVCYVMFKEEVCRRRHEALTPAADLDSSKEAGIVSEATVSIIN